MEVKTDPEFKTLIRELDTEEYRILKESIVAEGCREPILTWNGVIIDGHNRFQICTEENIPFKTAELVLQDRNDAKIWIIKNQLGRRNLNEYVRVALARQLEPLIAAKAKERQLATLKRGDVLPDTQNSAERGETRDELAKIAGVSHDTFSKVKKIEDSGEEGIKELARKGEISINQAAAAVKVSQKLKNGLFTSETPEWYTPKEIIDDILQMFGEIDLDPCSNDHENPNVPAKEHFTKEDDGLSKEWHGRIYMNPPYGREIGSWIEKIIQEYTDGNINEFIALVPARIDTEWFRKIAGFPAMWCGVDGRLKFSKSENSAPFPSAIFYLGERDKEFYEIFQKWGIIYQPYEYNGDLP